MESFLSAPECLPTHKIQLTFIIHYPNKIQKNKFHLCHQFILTTVSFNASFDSTFSQIQITQEIAKPEHIFYQTLIIYQNYATKYHKIQFKFVRSFNYRSKGAHSRNFMMNCDNRS